MPDPKNRKTKKPKNRKKPRKPRTSSSKRQKQPIAKRKRRRSPRSSEETLLADLLKTVFREKKRMENPYYFSLKEKQKRGIKWCKHPPLGYRWENGKMVLDKEELAIMITALRCRMDGVPLKQIAANFTESGFETRGHARWSHQRVWRYADALKKLIKTKPGFQVLRRILDEMG